MWKSKSWKNTQNPDKSQHRGLFYEDSRSAEFIMGNLKRYRIQSQETVVHLYSSDLADHLAWIPQVSYFQELLSCKVRVGSEYADLLSPSYPNLEFIKATEYMNNTDFNVPTPKVATKLVMIGTNENITGAMIDGEGNHKNDGTYNLQFDKEGKLKVGKLDKIKDRFVSELVVKKEQSKNRQIVAATKLGFKGYCEIKSKLDFPLIDKPTNSPYVTISTIGREKWDHWQNVVNYLISKGYDVVTVDNESSNLERTHNFSGYFSIESKASHIKQAEFHIGVKNEWGWLAWSLRTPSLTVSGELPEYEHNSLHMIEEEGIEYVKSSEVESAIDILKKEKENGKFTD